MKWIKKKKSKINKKRISCCIVGVSQGLGVTHTSLCLANYLHSVEGRRVVYVEIAKKSSMLPMLGQRQEVVDGICCYRYKGVSYVVSSTIKEAERIIKNVSADVIIDMGVLTDESREVFLQCNKKMVVGSLQPWQEANYVSYLRKINKIYDIKNIVLISSAGKKKIKRLNEVVIHEMPFVRDPFLLEEEQFEAIGELLV